VKNNLSVLGVVLVSGIVKSFTGAGHRYRRDQANAEALDLEEVREGAMIIARGFEGDAARVSIPGEQDGKLGKIFEVIGDPEVSTTPVTKLEQHEVMSLSDIHGYPQDRGSVRNKGGHG
jgi:hypothetical protein